MSRSARFRVAVTAAGVMIGTCFVWLWGGSNGPPVKIVLPDGYTGPVILVLDPNNGVEPSWAEDKYQIEIPSEGVIRVKSFDPFEHWHQEAWVYANGKVIPISSYIENPDPEVVMVRLGNSAVSRDVRWIEHFVGTEAQLNEYLRTPHSIPK